MPRQTDNHMLDRWNAIGVGRRSIDVRLKVEATSTRANFKDLTETGNREIKIKKTVMVCWQEKLEKYCLSPE